MIKSEKLFEGKTVTVEVELPEKLRNHCEEVRKSSYYKDYPESYFLEYLIAIGLPKYEKIILPIENGEEQEEAVA